LSFLLFRALLCNVSEFTKTELIATICAHERDRREKESTTGWWKKNSKKNRCVRAHKNATEKERERESFAARAHALALVANGLFKKKEREIWKKRREKKRRCA